MALGIMASFSVFQPYCAFISLREKKKLNGFCRHNIALIPVPFFLPDMLPKVKISIFGDLGSLLIFKKKLSTQK